MTTVRPRSCGAFTLIELLVAIAVGTMLMAATAAVARMAFAAVTGANRLAQENALLRAGICTALDEIDFWRSYDDPDAPPAQGQRLRRTISMEDGHQPGHPIKLGMSFTPLRDAWPDNSEEGVDLAAKHWSVADRRARWRGNIIERTSGDLREGRYAIFSNAHRNPLIGGSPDAGVYGTVTVPTQRTWLASQVRGLNRVLGYAGMFDYLPASAVYCWYGEYRAPPPSVGGAGNSPYPWQDGAPGQTPSVPGGTTNGGYDLEFVQEMRSDANLECRRNPFFCMISDWNNNNFPNIGAGAFPVVPPNNPITSTLTDQQMVHYHRWWFGMGDVFSTASANYAPTSVLTQPLLPLAPPHWPTVTVAVRRAATWARIGAECGIRWQSPLTGRTADLTFTATGTTLRGARQQRKAGGGWAKPGDPTLDD